MPALANTLTRNDRRGRHESVRVRRALIIMASASGTTDPDKDVELDRIEHLASSFPDRCFAFDQFGPLSIQPCHGTGQAQPCRSRW